MKITRVLIFLLFSAQNKIKTSGQEEKSIFSSIKISTSSGDCSISMLALIENNTIKTCSFDVDAESENLHNECFSCALTLSETIKGKPTRSVLDISEALFLDDKERATPLANHDPELHKIIPLRALKKALQSSCNPA
jgi:hypothetical protein